MFEPGDTERDQEREPLGCAEVVRRFAVVEQCCGDCHDGAGDCGGMKAVVVHVGVAVELEVCCAVLERVTACAA